MLWLQGNVYGKTTSYSVMCEEFMKGVLQEEHVEGSQHFRDDEMITVSTIINSSIISNQYQ